MDFRTYKLRTIIQVSGHKYCSNCYKTVQTFVNDIEDGDLLLIEFPLMIDCRSSGGPKPFQAVVTNMRTMKTLSMKSTELYSRILCWLEEPKEIDIL